MSVDPQRRASVIAAMEGAQLQALATVSPPEVLLLTGYWPVMGASLAIATRGGDVCAIVPEDELDLALATSGAKITAYQPHTLDCLTKASEALTEPLRKLAATLHLAPGRIGIESADGIQAASYQSSNHFRGSLPAIIRRAFPEASLTSADELLDGLRSIKTAMELEKLRRASKLAETAFREAKQTIAAGRREDEVAADLQSVFARNANDGFQRGSGYFFCMSGPNSAKAAGAYARTRRRVIEDGDLVMIHANTVGDGYWTDITRTFVVGDPSDRQKKMRDAIDRARTAALQAITPGSPARMVDQAARDVLKQHGFGAEFKHATGHGVGFAATSPNALPRIHPQSPDVLAAGMTFNIEPAIYFDGIGGMRHCDVVACTESGVEVLTDF